MNGWFHRSLQRQTELARGVDSDLVRDNHRRFRLALLLLTFSFLLQFFNSKLNASGILRLMVIGFSIIGLLAGIVLLLWAKEEAAFLSKPAPEDPPKIFDK